jgi:hypothetical protein
MMINTAALICWISGIANWISGAAIWGYTVFIAYEIGGLLSAILSGIFPVVSTLYWVYDRYQVTGYFWNEFTYVTSICFGINFLCYIIIFFFARFAESEE